ncbi:MAG: family 1 glycosylhydrolase, partial [Burkholderiaceae bacterium]
MKKNIELWGGLEGTVNRVQDQYFSQMERNGHSARREDLERFASLGIRAIRYPVLWERTAPDGLESADWTWPDERLPGLQALGITPIVGLVHHGSGPRHTSLVDPNFAEQLAEFAGAVAQRYPWVEYYTPVNEPLTTARFSGLYGVWYPHGRDERTFIQALLNQCRGVVLSMRAIRAVNPQAKLVQTDDLGKSYSTPEMADVANFYNDRRWLAWDLLCGMVDERHALWGYLTSTGIAPEEFLWFRDNPCPPDIIGVNYYITSERWLDHRAERYPERYVGGAPERRFADIETARALATPTPGIGPLLEEAWERYGLPLAVTEAHIDANREDQLRWLLEIWRSAEEVLNKGVDMRAVTVWALLGSYDWNCLVTECRGYYEPGPYDVRSAEPRATAVADLMRELSARRPLSHPVLQGQGWWRRPGRFFCPPVATSTAIASLTAELQHGKHHRVQPILITGATGTLGQAFARICETRNLAYRLLSRKDMDIADPASVERAIEQYQPWAIINAGGYVRVNDAEKEAERCLRDNTHGAAVLAVACIRHKLQLLTYSSDLVFDGQKQAPYVESDAVSPLNMYGRSKVDAERRVLTAYPEALVIRTSSFFGPWDRHNFVTQALDALAQGNPFAAASDMTVSPTYVPDLVHASLDLLIDKECGIWHLTNTDPLTWYELARKACEMANVDPGLLEARSCAELGYAAARPAYSALSSERAILLPSLDDALSRYLRLRQEAAEKNDAGQAAHEIGLAV